MKRIIALFLTFLLVFTFIGCDKDENGKPTVDEAAWKKAAEIANFDNVTMKMSVIMPEGEGDFVIKLDGNKAVVDGIFTEDEVTVSGCKDIYVKTSLAMVENFSDFVYDSETPSRAIKRSSTMLRFKESTLTLRPKTSSLSLTQKIS